MVKAVVEAEVRVTRNLPWEGCDPQLYPYQLRHWLPHLPTGGFFQVKEKFQVEGKPPNHKVYNRGPVVPIPRDGGPDLISFEEMVRIFEVSADRGISLLDAMVIVKGEDTIAPAWLERMKKAPKQYASEKYRTQVEEATPPTRRRKPKEG